MNRLTNIFLLTALVLSLAGGSATAAALITGAKIKNGTVTSADVRNGSLASKDLRRSLRAQLAGKTTATPGPAGARGPAGPPGAPGVRGPAGPSAAEVAERRNVTLTSSSPSLIGGFRLEPGTYLVDGLVRATSTGGGDTCGIEAGGKSVDGTEVNLPESIDEEIVLRGELKLRFATVVNLRCTADDQLTIAKASLRALQVATLEER